MLLVVNVTSESATDLSLEVADFNKSTHTTHYMGKNLYADEAANGALSINRIRRTQ